MNTELITVKGQHVYNKIRNGLFNVYRVKVIGLSIHADDVTLTYSIRTDQKINKLKLLEIKAFCQGIVYGCQ